MDTIQYIYKYIHLQNMCIYHICFSWLLVCHMQIKMNCSPFKYWIWKENVSSKRFVWVPKSRDVFSNRSAFTLVFEIEAWKGFFFRCGWCWCCWEKERKKYRISIIKCQSVYIRFIIIKIVIFNLRYLIIVGWCVVSIYYTHSKDAID